MSLPRAGGPKTGSAGMNSPSRITAAPARALASRLIALRPLPSWAWVSFDLASLTRRPAPTPMTAPSARPAPTHVRTALKSRSLAPRRRSSTGPRYWAPSEATDAGRTTPRLAPPATFSAGGCDCGGAGPPPTERSDGKPACTGCSQGFHKVACLGSFSESGLGPIPQIVGAWLSSRERPGVRPPDADVRPLSGPLANDGMRRCGNQGPYPGTSPSLWPWLFSFCAPARHRR